MKILIYTDPHFCEKFSIVTKMGDKFTQRLENQIKSINWVERLAEKEGCSMVICAGDFFDKPSLTPDEITALQKFPEKIQLAKNLFKDSTKIVNFGIVSKILKGF